MEWKNIRSRGVFVQTSTVFDGSEWITSSQPFEVSNGFTSVSPGPSSKGDFKTPTVPWTYSITDVYGMRGSVVARFTNSVQSQALTGFFLQDNPGTSSDWQNYVQLARDQARAKCIEKLNDNVRGSLDLATSIAEGGQTVKMLSLTRRLTDALAYTASSWKRDVLRQLSSFKRRRRVQRYLDRWQRGIASRYRGSYTPIRVTPGVVSRVTSNLANGWCEFTYGWRPLMGDIYGVASNIVGQVKNSLNLYTVRASSLVTSTYDTQIPGLNLWHDAKVEVSVNAMHTFGVRLRREDPALARWTSLNPLAVAYELMPYSFVLDWFVDIGGYMRNLETSLRYGSNFISGYEGSFTKASARSVCNSFIQNGNSIETCSGNGSVQEKVYSRSLLSSYPAPTFPSFQVDLGSSRLLSAAALLRQLIRR